ncbi:bidirectional sugar transporter SWEET12-like [Asparagus officinalis]|uniref:bidirectional sugar transporter SWEET12-like n=1 Tax=Asparagus officinalis TaxID=4686 RepID=UPI00098DF40A|nr:bidirectional sugar transporter SWEET12-like [Asparagus officinalis]XP_020267944.1 bidirectional sugar transporter SWEET12-like [Asparagus officinalis]
MVVITIENPWIFGVGLLGNLTSFLVVMSPVPTFYRIYKKKSTESFQSIPYAVAVFSATLWLYYAVLTRDVLLLTINTATLFIEAAYLAIYLIYAPGKAQAFTLKLIFLLNVGLYGSMILLTLLFLKGKRRVALVGGICAAFAVSVFVAPLSIIKLVIRTKSVEYMPFSLSFFLTLSALAWFCYGLLLKDFFVAFPNVMGFLFGMAQMILYFIYMNKNKDEPVPNLTEVVHVHPTRNSEIEVIHNNEKEAARPET